jgi:hypothetical protein
MTTHNDRSQQLRIKQQFEHTVMPYNLKFFGTVTIGKNFCARSIFPSGSSQAAKTQFNQRELSQRMLNYHTVASLILS